MQERYLISDTQSSDRGRMTDIVVKFTFDFRKCPLIPGAIVRTGDHREYFCNSLDRSEFRVPSEMVMYVKSITITPQNEFVAQVIEDGRECGPSPDLLKGAVKIQVGSRASLEGLIEVTLIGDMVLRPVREVVNDMVRELNVMDKKLVDLQHLVRIMETAK